MVSPCPGIPEHRPPATGLTLNAYFRRPSRRSRLAFTSGQSSSITAYHAESRRSSPRTSMCLRKRPSNSAGSAASAARARSFAGARNAMLGVRRWAYALATPLLVPVLIMRIVRNVRARTGYASAFRSAAPLLLVYTTISAFGELVGYIFGGGRSILRVR